MDGKPIERLEMKKEHSLWVEKYRPKTLDDFIGNEQLKQSVRTYIDRNDVPHLLFYGEAGTGKTTLAQIIADNTDSDVEYINASDENRVETIRTKVKTFASLNSFAAFKLIILDEFDFMSLSAQAALRHLMEYFSLNTRFILTCNYHDRILDPIKSRTQSFYVAPPSRRDVAIHVAGILEKENIKYEVDDVALITNKNYPDIRRTINQAQQNSLDGVLRINQKEMIDSDFRLKLIEILKNRNNQIRSTQKEHSSKWSLEQMNKAIRKISKQSFADVRQLIADNKIGDFAHVYRHLYDAIEDYAPNNVSDVIVQLNDGMKNEAFVVDKEINFMNTVINILNTL